VRVRTPMVLLAIPAVAILWGCTGSSTSALPDADFFVNQGAPFLIRMGEAAGVQTVSTVVIVQMSDVLDDNRCPSDVTCVDAGHATVKLAVQTALEVQDVLIEVPPDGNAEVIVEEVTVTVLGLNPATEEGTPIDLINYEIALRVVETGDIGVPQQ
jgi:hypothetical protein